METFTVANTGIALAPDPATGTASLQIQATPWGAQLARLLADELPPVAAGCYHLPHTAQVDARLCALIELFITARYTHPQLLQLRLLPQEAPAWNR